MPRHAGESEKLGNFYEAVWTVKAALDVFRGKFRSITVEAFGEESVGVEFHLEKPNGVLQFHSVKRQKTGGDWSIADLCRDSRKGKSILGDLIQKQQQWPNAETCFVSATGANMLRELNERSRTPANVAQFREVLSGALRDGFDSRIVPLCNGNPNEAFLAIKALHVVLIGHRELIRWVEQEIDLLFHRNDGEPTRADDMRRMIAEFICNNLGKKLDKEEISAHLRDEGIGVKDWKMDATVNDAVAAANRRYLSGIEVELINSAQIVRDLAGGIIDSLNMFDSRGALLVAPGGFGKSCVLAQCVAQLSKLGTPHLCLKLDAFDPCKTAKQLGMQMDLHASPAVVLAGIADNSPSVILVDQLDAMSHVSGRNPQMWEVFSELRNEVSSFPKMKMILACREFDLEHDHRLRNLGDAKSGFATFPLMRLSESEVYASVGLAGHGQLRLSPKQIEILRIPIHLQLYLRGDPGGSFSTEGELYDRYWDRKRLNLKMSLGREPNWNEVIDVLTSRMSDEQLLFVPVSATEDWHVDAKAMASEHVLIEDPQKRQYRFFHESFFDYAFARRFCAKNGNVVELLKSSEQHLFRRSQVRQIMNYRRVNDFDKYIADLREIFESQEIRFHIKQMVASEISRIEHPDAKEWRLLEPYVLDGELSRYVSSALKDHSGWFDLINSQGVFEHWLAASDVRLQNAAIWFLEAPKLNDERSAEIARLIRPYAKLGGEWKRRIHRIMSWGQAHKSSDMTEIYLELVANGAYDEFQSEIAGTDFWGQVYNSATESPEFFIDVLATWFRRAVQQFDDGTTNNFLNLFHQNRSQIGASAIGKAAASRPEYFIEKVLPIARDTIFKTAICKNGKMLSRIWPQTFVYDDPWKIDDAVLLCLYKSLQSVAICDAGAFRLHVASIEKQPHMTFAYLLLKAWMKNPIEFANECVEYIIADPCRLDVGYRGSLGSGEGTGQSAITRIALQAVTPHCSDELLHRLESHIMAFCPDYEKQIPQRRGYAELLILLSLDQSRVLKQTALRIEELKRKFPTLTDPIAGEGTRPKMNLVKPPIDQLHAERMTDEQWITAMEKYDGSTDRYQGGPHELSGLLSELAMADPNRFAALVADMPDNVEPIYFSAILEGISKNYNKKTQEVVAADHDQFSSFPTESIYHVFLRLHELPNHPCGSAIVSCVRRMPPQTLPKEVIDIVAFYALEDPDPCTDEWLETANGIAYHDGDPYSHGINCVRGQAAEAIAHLIRHDRSMIEALRPAMIALSQDKIISVRTCAINAFLSILNFDRDLAVELFLKACGGCEAICGTVPFDRFVHFAIHTHYPQLRELLQFALKSGNPKAIENASQQIIVGELEGIEEVREASEIRRGNETMRSAAAGVYSTNLSDERVGDQCAARLEEFFNDESEVVRVEVSRAFFSLSGERLLQLKDFIARFVESRSFEDGPDPLLHCLKESNAELPQVVCRTAERILGFLGSEGTHIAFHGAMTANDISTLIFRQYEQTVDQKIEKWCLDLIDQMLRIGYFGICENLSKVDR